MTTDTGGAYHPTDVTWREQRPGGQQTRCDAQYGGATLLDEFAKAAMQGVLAKDLKSSGDGIALHTSGLPHPEELSEWAYDYAEAMIAEKRKREAE